MSRFYFHPFHWTSKDLKDGFFFFVEGHDTNNNSCLVRIKYKPWFYILIPDRNQDLFYALEKYLKTRTYPGSIAEISQEMRKETYYYGSPEQLLMKISFHKMKNLKFVVKLLAKPISFGDGDVKFQVYEDKDDSIIKYHFERGLNHTGWHYVETPRMIKGDDMISEFQKECLVNDSNSVFLEKDEEKIRNLGIPKPTILSFDIECVGDEGKFPKPEFMEDKMFMISCSFLDKDSSIKKYTIVMGRSIRRPDVELIEVEKEQQLCIQFSNLVRDLDPDILIGHNVFKFDWRYMDIRYGILTNSVIPYMGRYKNWKMKELGENLNLVEGRYFEDEWESSAYADQKIGFLLTPGRIQMDLLPIVQRLGYKLDSYKLEFISQNFLGEGKTGLEPKEMFHLFKLSRECNRILKENNKELCSQSSFKEVRELDISSNWRQRVEDLEINSMFEIDKYCVQDTLLPIRIAQKINLWIGLIEDAKVVHVNIIDLYTRGQGIRVYNQEYMELKAQGYFIKKIKVQKRKYKGAFVFSALVGYYKRVHCLDFAKLYPSIMIAFNICYTTFVQEEMFKPNPEIKDEDCNVFEWEEEDEEEEDESKKKIKYRFRFVKPHVRKGILPTLLERLADARDDAKAQLKKEKNELMKIVLDKRQNNIKISMNSIYGNKGTNMAKLPLYEAAMCTTAKGRQLIHQTAYHIESRYGAKVVYGDSVTPDTPILIRRNDQVEIETIENLGKNWKEYKGFKVTEEGLYDKQQDDNVNFEVWTDKGWSKVKRVIKHKSHKKIYEVLTHTGCVRVTEDHSLLTPSLEQVKPNKIDVGTELLHSYPKDFINKDVDLEEDRAYIYGFFLGDGSCGRYKYNNSYKYSWALNTNNYSLCEKLKKKLERVYKNNFKILNTIKSSAVYKIVPSHGNIKSYVEEYSCLYNNKRSKIIPLEILNSNKNIRKSFLDGYYDADGSVKEREKIGCSRCDIKSEISASNLFYLLKSLDYNVSINKRKDKPEMFRLTFSNKSFRKNPIKIKKITEIPNNYEYVYDLETECGRFQAGVGEMIVKNTDSVMFTLPVLDDGHFKNILQKQVDKYQIPNLVVKIAKDVSSLFPKPVMMEYEKTFRDYLLIGKKMYSGMLADGKDLDLFNEKKLFFRGLPVVRRDNCKYLRETMKNICIMIFKGKTEDEVFDYILDRIEKLISGKVDAEELYIYKKIGNEDKYKSGTADMALFIKYLKSKGEEPVAGDRYEYLLAKVDCKYKGDKYRTVQYLKEEGLDIDYELYYESYFAKPIQKVIYRWNPKKFPKNLLTVLSNFMRITGKENLKNRFLEFYNKGNMDEDISTMKKEQRKTKKEEEKNEKSKQKSLTQYFKKN